MAGYVQAKIEESPRYQGAPLTAPTRLATEAAWFPVQSFEFEPGVQHEDRSDELRGIDGGVPLLIDTYEVGGTLAERGYLNNLTWLLEIAGLTGVHTSGDGIITDPDTVAIPVGAHRWVYTKSTTA